MTDIRVAAIAFVIMAMAGPTWSAPPPIAPNQPLTLPVLPAPTSIEPPLLSGILAAHNRARRAVGVPDLAWSQELSRTAQGWAEKLRAMQCEMRHSRATGLGENLTWASGQHLRPEAVVGIWLQEARSYNPTTGRCAAGGICGHYTQVVWRSTRFVGCGMVSCGNSEVWVCNYAPPGNFSGERPY